MTSAMWLAQCDWQNVTGNYSNFLWLIEIWLLTEMRAKKLMWKESTWNFNYESNLNVSETLSWYTGEHPVWWWQLCGIFLLYDNTQVLHCLIRLGVVAILLTSYNILLLVKKIFLGTGSSFLSSPKILDSGLSFLCPSEKQYFEHDIAISFMEFCSAMFSKRMPF